MARDIGDISSLFPPGVTTLIDLPFTIHQAILAALSFLSYDELPEADKPPKKIWLNQKKMEAWWAGVKERRKAEAEGGGSQTSMTKGSLIEKLVVGM